MLRADQLLMGADGQDVAQQGQLGRGIRPVPGRGSGLLQRADRGGCAAYAAAARGPGTVFLDGRRRLSHGQLIPLRLGQVCHHQII